MTTVLSVGNSEGERRCDARCHDAGPFTDCDCVCGGRYHGAGQTQVLERVQADIVEGVFGETVPVDGPRHIKRVRGSRPDVVRFHRRAVSKALLERLAAGAADRRA